MIQPPLLGVVTATSAVSARTVTCHGPAAAPGDVAVAADDAINLI
jgi:hypothetical protein